MIKEQDVVSALTNDFSTNVISIYVNSLKRNVQFREPTIKEEKTLTKIILGNQDKQHVFYAACAALIMSLCCDKTIKIGELLDFDFLKIMMRLFNGVFFTKTIHLTCQNEISDESTGKTHKCENNVEFRIPYNDIVKKLDLFDLDDKSFSIKNGPFEIEYTLNFPSIRRQINFLETIEDYTDSINKDIEEKNKASLKSKVEPSLDEEGGDLSDSIAESHMKKMTDAIKMRQMIKNRELSGKDKEDNPKEPDSAADKPLELPKYSIIDYPDIFIKSFRYRKILDGDNPEQSSTPWTEVDLTTRNFEDSEAIISAIPASLMRKPDSDDSVIDFIGKKLTSKLRDATPVITCPKCGKNISEGIDLQYFFMLGQ
jgi:hypothetical protein